MAHAPGPPVRFARANEAASIVGGVTQDGDVLGRYMESRRPQMFPWAQPGAVPKVPVIPSFTHRPLAAPPMDMMAAINESCFTRSLIAGLMGGVLGLGMGVMFGGNEHLTPPLASLPPGQPVPPGLPMRVQMRGYYKQVGAKSKDWSKNFAIVGGTERARVGERGVLVRE